MQLFVIVNTNCENYYFICYLLNAKDKNKEERNVNAVKINALNT